jgi:hypothetical protein
LIHRTSIAVAKENLADVLGCGNHFFSSFSSGAHLRASQFLAGTCPSAKVLKGFDQQPEPLRPWTLDFGL